MTEQEWLSATDEERNAEYERCKDPVYYYNTYWMVQYADGNMVKPNPLTQQQWELMTAYSETYTNRRLRRFKRPYRVSDVKKFIPPIFNKPNEKR